MERQIIIDGQPTIYVISEDGVVTNTQKGKELKPFLAAHKYPAVGLFVNGRSHTRTIHSLLRTTFPGNLPELNRVTQDNSSGKSGPIENPIPSKPQEEEFTPDPEVWRKVYRKGEFTGVYVNRYGQLIDVEGNPRKTYRREFVNKNGTKRVHFVFSVTCNSGYHSIDVHRVVAEAFIPNPNDWKFVHFRDGDSSNHSAENLYWSPRLVPDKPDVSPVLIQNTGLSNITKPATSKAKRLAIMANLIDAGAEPDEIANLMECDVSLVLALKDILDQM